MRISQRPKRIIALHDLSCFGRCSLTTALPILSAMGFQVCPVPTAIFTGHTAYAEYKMKDLTDFVPKCLEHWRQAGFKFECVYSGFLSTHAQIDQVLAYIDYYESALVVVDPVMGDNGTAYRSVSKQIQRHMHELVEKADLITPNVTEASILLEEEYPQKGMNFFKLKEWMTRLAEMGPQYVVITGVKGTDGKYCNAAYDRIEGKYWFRPVDYQPHIYYGTGDAFTSVMTGCILEGKPLKDALAEASRFVELCIGNTDAEGEELKEGIYFEHHLAFLITTQKDKTVKEMLV